ncbi:hypothetical protein MKQ68_14975 [Chitinophaga horti]|uniref:Glucose/arabinose dehydrogenase, beta-propeller fold n=1 Tax=Chitinophaga horti TaxID=2920382 RepID=A0ABY6IVK1_9BACT|nr:hypothetical protein [Chitinophaga horti]UYQ91395.1 hypothetical protein MKQ68_14975 [Chitinophaga horti]
MQKLSFSILFLGLFINMRDAAGQMAAPRNFSGVYPKLAMYNKEGECGTGAVVPWAGNLWVITYGPHLPYGSSDKLYEINPQLQQTVRSESIGGTPANRMIHPESKQLFIGPYAIDDKGQVRTIPYTEMQGRHTGNARHLTDPSGKIYYGTMEEGFYEVDVHTLEPKQLYPDRNKNGKVITDPTSPVKDLLPGAHGKGLYSGQGVMIYSNNGEPTKEAEKKYDIQSGVLAEWDGKDWKVVRRNQFVEVTGPGGINGNANPATDPIWATGWDHKSVLLGLRQNGGWQFFRLPKASHSYDGAHGWNTEWPRIRNVGTNSQPDYLMTMHGMFWRFPGTFSADNTVGIRPRSAYLRVVGDFTRWNDQLVFGCDDSAQKEFLNKRKAKGNIEGPGQSNSNLWFTSLQLPDQLGPVTAEGAVWIREDVKANEYSEPFLFAGWPVRSAWLQNNGREAATFTFETDNGEVVKTLNLPAGKAAQLEFDNTAKGEWIKAKSNKATNATLHFSYKGKDARNTQPAALFNGLAKVTSAKVNGGLIYGLGNDRRTMGMNALSYNGAQSTENGYYELTDDMELVKRTDDTTSAFIRDRFAIPKNAVTVDAASVLVIDDAGRRWRLPMGNDAFTPLTHNAALRVCREVATERDLFNCHGTFYELPAENADGYAKIRPVASHNYRINDYASYRGLLVLTGLDPNAKAGEHIIVSNDKKAAVWAGVIDDLWKLGKPTGRGGPWKNSAVKAGVASDPYLVGFYDQRNLALSHTAAGAVTFTIEADPVGTGVWMPYLEVKVAPGQTYQHTLPAGFEARWVRVKADKDCTATCWLTYK